MALTMPLSGSHVKSLFPVHQRYPSKKSNFRIQNTMVDSLSPASWSTKLEWDSIVTRLGKPLDTKERLRLLVGYGRELDAFPAEDRTLENLVMGCASQVWIRVEQDAEGMLYFTGDSDSEISKGLCAVLCTCLSGKRPQDIMDIEAEAVAGLELDINALTHSRTNGWRNILEAMKRRARVIAEGREGGFPSITITREGITAEGEFADAQVAYLEPDDAIVERIASTLSAKKLGVVAHYYMDPEVQGVLTAAKEKWPHIFISDSLVMADKAVDMVKDGCEAIALLGVDFMAENARAVLNRSGYKHVPVYRMAAEEIGCSLAEAAESPQYESYLTEAAQSDEKALHVIYINTSLVTKAASQKLVPTITCTSSNVVQTILQAFAQVPELNVYYGPDTYMGRNIKELFHSMTTWPDEDIRAMHPMHTKASVRALIPNFHIFEDGTCIVHHIFGNKVVNRVKNYYGDAFLTAHFEVPGEMFGLAMKARERGMGVVGSTKNILDFISEKVSAAIEKNQKDRLQFVLGTESGMITSIVARVKQLLKGSTADIRVEVVFPVSTDAISTVDREQTSDILGGLAIVPGTSGAEGCSAAGGCASCPYMKMNTLSALEMICEKMGTEREIDLKNFVPRVISTNASALDEGIIPIMNMRDFQKMGKLGDSLVEDISSRRQ